MQEWQEVFVRGVVGYGNKSPLSLANNIFVFVQEFAFYYFYTNAYSFLVHDLEIAYSVLFAKHFCVCYLQNPKRPS